MQCAADVWGFFGHSTSFPGFLVLDCFFQPCAAAFEFDFLFALLCFVFVWQMTSNDNPLLQNDQL